MGEYQKANVMTMRTPSGSEGSINCASSDESEDTAQTVSQSLRAERKLEGSTASDGVAVSKISRRQLVLDADF